MGAPFRLGLIGAGRQGRHLSAAARALGDCELVACADPDTAVAGQTQRDFGYQHTYRDHETLLAEAVVDGVLVATPHNLLAPVSHAVIAAGRHVFIEKPVGVHAGEVREVVAAAEAAGVTLMVGYCLRYTPVRLLMKELIDDGAIGDIVFVSAGKGGAPLSGWLADPQAGGGQLLFLGSHVSDQLLWVVGQPATQVYSTMRYRPGTDVDATSAFMLTFANGVTAQVTCSHEVHQPYDFVEVYGTRGNVRADWPLNTLIVQSDVVDAYREPTTIHHTGDPFDPMYIAEVQEFVAAARVGRSAAISGEAAVAVSAILDAVKESHRRGQPVALP